MNPAVAIESSTTRGIVDTLTEISIRYGSGDLRLDAFVFLLLFALLLVVLGVLALVFTSNRKESTKGTDRLDGLLGRLERSERTIHEFRSDVLRSLDLWRQEFEYTRSEITAIREILTDRHSALTLEDKLAADGTETRRSTGDRLREVLARETSGDTPAEEEPVGTLDRGWARPKGTAEDTSGVSGTTHSSAVRAESESEEAPARPSLASRLQKSRSSLFQKIRSIFGGKPNVDPEMLADLEATLVGSDLGIKTTVALLSQLKDDVAQGLELTENGLVGVLKLKLLSLLDGQGDIAPIRGPRRREDGPVVVLVVGVNGVGKTTSVAKLAKQWKDEGSSVLMVAADTFRAAAVEQLHEWGRRLQIPVISGAPDAKPQTVVFDAMTRAQDETIDVVIVDTAGRLHTKSNLMEELGAIRSMITKQQPGAPHEVLLVVDGSTGQNAIAQAKEFHAATTLTGLIVTKLDGTAKGGVVVAIREELGTPIRYIGVGEAAEDLRPFVAREFVEALLSQDGEDGAGDGTESANAATRRRRREG